VKVPAAKIGLRVVDHRLARIDNQPVADTTEIAVSLIVRENTRTS
jgi:DNA-binding LacI/PurR family transcriptional regulator